MVPTSVQSRAADARGATRASIYLAATLYRDGSPAPVKIRNISTSGALVEGSVMPDTGEIVQLVRGGLIVHGLVAWSGEGRCGIRFSGSVDVQQWRASPSNVEQQRVDEIVRLVKAGAVPLPVPPLVETNQLNEISEPDASLCEDLRQACKLLDALAEVLASDPSVVTRHGLALQNLDLAVQMIAAVEGIISGQRGSDGDATKFTSLGRGADEALQHLF